MAVTGAVARYDGQPHAATGSVLGVDGDVLGQAGQAAIKRDPDLKRLYYAVLHRRGRSRAKIAVAR